ncbi:hypothetical protein PMW_207 [Pseudomonas phage phiPMW]|uniref:Uncharacterized protein n=1 Tax=Pseudomonas phage phiPMW TaxID=1815582 RepID=A0A1S5R1M0_9CAUD|nr:hypothetical protein FDG97_gp143 [Pseudomonas phage phiPMW]ANA49332.1 hypothetical protein PMW_207 [Pseudomonas phage phiPMW]
MKQVGTIVRLSGEAKQRFEDSDLHPHNVDGKIIRCNSWTDQYLVEWPSEKTYLYTYEDIQEVL